MRKFLATHPLVAGAALYLLGFCGLVSIGLAAFAVRWEITWPMLMGWWSLCVLGPLAVALVLTCIRRRAGLRTGSLWLLPLTLALQTMLVHWPAALMLTLPFVFTPPSDWAGFAERLGSVLKEMFQSPHDIFQRSFALHSYWPAALGGCMAPVGILIGLAIAQWRLRSGRWEHIVPVERPKA